MLKIQHAFEKALRKRFQGPLHALIVHTYCQINLKVKVNFVYPTVWKERWISNGKVSSCIIVHKIHIKKHIHEKARSSSPWIIVADGNNGQKNNETRQCLRQGSKRTRQSTVKNYLLRCISKIVKILKKVISISRWFDLFAVPAIDEVLLRIFGFCVSRPIFNELMKVLKLYACNLASHMHILQNRAFNLVLQTYFLRMLSVLTAYLCWEMSVILLPLVVRHQLLHVNFNDFRHTISDASWIQNEKYGSEWIPLKTFS